MGKTDEEEKFAEGARLTLRSVTSAGARSAAPLVPRRARGQRELTLRKGRSS